MANLTAVLEWGHPSLLLAALAAELQQPLTLLVDPVGWVRRVDAGVSALAVVLVVTLATYVLSVVSGNCSQVDRLWSIVPVYYGAHFAFLAPALHSHSSAPPVRPQLMTVLMAVWGVRLTYNFARKGGYTWASEDHRWPVLRQVLTGLPWELFKLLFIAVYQNVLLFLFSGAPVYVASLSAAPLSLWDAFLTGLFVLFLAGEVVADQQQWNFQTAKHSKPRPPDPTGELRDGFLQSGLFWYSRHPNFFCEMAMWWVIYGFTVSATGVWLNWSVVGTVLLTLLFQGSTAFTEYLSQQKYPTYTEYCQRTSRLVPLWPRAAAPRVTPARTRTRSRSSSTTPTLTTRKSK